MQDSRSKSMNHLNNLKTIEKVLKIFKNRHMLAWDRYNSDRSTTKLIICRCTAPTRVTPKYLSNTSKPLFMKSVALST